MLEFSSVNALHRCLQRGIGLSICPAVSAAGELEGGSLAKLNWEVKDESTSVLMIWHAEKWCSPLLRRFMALAREAMEV